MGAPQPAIPVAKPKLPDADALLPYLRRMDHARWYSNGGPLVRALEARLAEHAGTASAAHVAVTANATAALTATLMALEAPLGSLCMIPAWTFVATAHAAVQAGLVPWLVDVGPHDGALAPHDALRLAAHAPGPLGAVLAVAPFGVPADVRGWERFRAQTGVAVVLDAAAGFDTVRASAIPTAVSLHATKTLGVGEGGFVVWNDADGVREIRRRTNFGFAGSREAAVPALNAKLSEYAAAVGLAALDRWPATRAEWQRVAESYAHAVAGSGREAEIALQPGYGERWISSTTIVRLPAERLTAIEHALDAEGIGSRRWWGGGLARHPAFAGYPRTALPVTDALAASALGLPCWPDLPEQAIRRIVDVVASVCLRAPA
ncbi:MAG: hypothetical protein QOI11_1372 [Candidatus Eremiobacteraeota bacterium]|jgi:dTDP-4-amino-4,6-dideoxygalactose transaminase|nr:hypothetical protein [Candidatus Eremiobacteraeota bacterium]